MSRNDFQVADARLIDNVPRCDTPPAVGLLRVVKILPVCESILQRINGQH